MPARKTLCVIARNEQVNLPVCLRSAADLVDELIVLDTGSTDRTQEVAPALGRLGTPIRKTDIVIAHSGYDDPALLRRKQERNLRLLHLEDHDHPDDPFTLFNLGWAYLDLGRMVEALAFLHRSLERSPPW